MSKPKLLVIGKSRVRADVINDVEEYLEIKKQLTELNKKADALKNNIKSYMIQNKVAGIVSGDKQVKMEQVTRSPVSGVYTAYDTESVMNILSPAEFKEVAEVVVNRDLLNANIKAKAYTSEKIVRLQIEASLAEPSEQFVVRKA